MLILGEPPYIALDYWQSIMMPIESVAFAVKFLDFTAGSPTNWDDIISSLWVRRAVKTSSGTPVLTLPFKEKPYKLYPVDQLSLIILQPLPQTFINNAIECSLEFIKVFKYKNYAYTEPNYKIEFYGILS